MATLRRPALRSRVHRSWFPGTQINFANRGQSVHFDVNPPLYRERNYREEPLRRCVWGDRRLSERAKVIVAQLYPPDDELAGLMEEARGQAAE